MSAGRQHSEAMRADWLGLCRRATDEIRSVLERSPDSADRAVATGRGAGGDEALSIDREAEAAIFRELDSLHEQGHQFRAVSEERGCVEYGNGSSDVTVVIDPIDGSLNAKRLVPTFSVSIAVASGRTMEDVRFGYVYDFGAGEEYVARLGEGTELDGGPLDPEQRGGGLEIVGFESARPGWVAPVAARLGESVYRMRIAGSIAVTLCYVGAARFDGMLTMSTCRSVDAAAGQLIAREAGAFVSILGFGGLEAPLALDARFRLAAARTPESLETLVRALTGAGPATGG